MKMMKRCLSFVLMLVMLAGLLPVMGTPASAAAEIEAAEIGEQAELSAAAVADEGWLWPVEATAANKKISSPYSVGTTWWKAERWMQGGKETGRTTVHGGVDILVTNVPVFSIRSGVVADISGSQSSAGGYIVRIKSKLPKKIKTVSGAETDVVYIGYLHLQKDSMKHYSGPKAGEPLKIGDPIQQGEQIAISGNSGNVGYHLHVCICTKSGGVERLPQYSIDPNPYENLSDGTIKNVCDDVSTSRMLSEKICAGIHYKFDTHTHTYGSTGYCTNCSVGYPLEDLATVAATYETTAAVPLKAEPYPGAKTTTTIPKGECITPSRQVKSYNNEQWYSVTYNKIPGWIRVGNLKSAPVQPSKIEFSQMWEARNVVKGNGCHISGTITSRYDLSAITANIVKPGTTDVVLYGTPVKAAGKTYSIYNQPLDNGLKFANLPVGSYQLLITVTDSKGFVQSWKSGTFQVTAPNVQTCAKPTVATTDVDGGKNVTVSTATSGATVSVTANGKTYTGTGSVSFKLTQTANMTIKVSKSGMQSFTTTVSVSVGTCATPALSAGRMTAKGMEITMAVAAGETGYYSVNGAAFQKYTGPFYLTASGIVQAYTKRSGWVNSSNVRQSYTLTAPAAPMPKLMGISANIAAGSTVTIQWPAVDFATGYTVQVKKDGVDYKTIETATTSAGFAAAEAGSYSAAVTAKNLVGSSAASSAVTVTAHDPLTVTFKSDDDTVLTTQTVRYGADAQAPDTVPAKRGYTFTGWDKSLANITADTVITAKFAINTYTVRFYDCNGTDLLGAQRLAFGQGIASEDMEAKVSLRTGYSFVGWHIQEAAVDSDMDLEHIDSDMTLVATEHWAIGSLPVVVSNVAAARNEESTGYNVSFKLACAPASTIGGNTKKIKVIVTLKSKSNQMLASAVETVNLTESQQDLSRSVFVSYDGTSLADKAEVSVVGIDGNDRTGGALAETKSATPTVTKRWSEWMTALPNNIGGAETATKTQYRYKDSTRSTTTQTTTSSTAPTLSGWKLISTSSAYPSTWSAWSDSYIASSATREVQTQQVKTANAYTQYRYGRWQDKTGWGHYCPTLGKNYNGNTYSTVYTPWSTTQYTRSHTNYGACSNNSHTHIGRKSNNYWDRWLINNKGYYWEETQTVPATYKTQYRYHDKNFTYTYEKWSDGAWAAWSDTPYTASNATNSKRAVETRTMYRYVLAGDQVVDTPSTVTTRTVSAAVPDTAVDLNGKLANVLIYKETNSDPTEPQLEYVGQVTLDSDNSFSIDIQTKEEPSTATGDFVVALALQGSSNVVNVGKINAPAETYTVNFYDNKGELVDTQQVSEGESAQVPAAPALDGYTFVCWSSDTTRVLRDMEVTAVYVPDSYSVAFVDFENENITLDTGYRYGDVLLLPDSPAKEGMEFAGWQVTYNSTGETADIQVSAPVEAEDQSQASALLLAAESQAELLAAGGFAVNDDLIVTAKWTPITYEVKFLDADGTALSSQTVAHGQSAQPPAYANVPADMIFLGWNVEQEWWCVKNDMNVYPILVYKETAQAPVVNGDNLIEGTSATIELEAEDGAEIYYTTDGSEPEPGVEGTELYTGPIELVESAEINAVSVKPGKNNSETVYVAFWYNETAEEAEVTDLRDVGTYNVVAEPGKTITLQFEIENNPGLAGYMFYVDANPAIFSIPEDVETGETGVATGAVCANGTLLTAPYVEGLGWQLLWFSATPANGNGTLCTVTLETSEDAETGTYPITVRYSPANTFDGNFDAKDIPGVRVDFVGTTEFRMGDVNADGRVTNADVVLIARHIIGLSRIAQERQFLGDVNNDGELTLADAIYLARYILGLEHSLM